MTATMARTHVEGTYRKLAGEDIPLAAKLVCNELMGSVPVNYTIASNPQVVRLGVLEFFAMLVVFMNLKEGFGTILIPNYYVHEKYGEDRYGTNGISAKQFLSAFGMEIIDSIKLRPIRDNECREDEILSRKTGIVIASTMELETTFGISGKFIRLKRLTLPIIKDDGETLTRSEPDPQSFPALW